MSDVWQGPGWWLASDGKWYPADAEPGAVYEGDLSNDNTTATEEVARADVYAGQAGVADSAPDHQDAAAAIPTAPADPDPMGAGGFVGDPFARMPEPGPDETKIGGWQAIEPEPVIDAEPAQSLEPAQPIEAAPAPSFESVEAAQPVEEDGWTSAYEERQATGEVIDDPLSHDVLPQAPGVEFREPQIPDVQAPAPIPTPDFAAPDPTVPDLTVPDLSVPDLSVPDLSVPDVQMPDLSVPDVQMPDLSVADLPVPETSSPGIPDIPMPAAIISPVSLPEVQIDDVAAPDSFLPEVDVPELTIPDETVPTIPVSDLASPPIDPPAMATQFIEREDHAPIVSDFDDAQTFIREADTPIERADAWRKPSDTEMATSRIDAPFVAGTPDVVDLAIPDEPIEPRVVAPKRNWRLPALIVLVLVALAAIAWLLTSLFSNDGPNATDTQNGTTVAPAATSDADSGSTDAPATTEAPDDGLESVFSLRAGDCIVGDIGAGQVTKVEKVDCEVAHQFEVYREDLIPDAITVFDEVAISSYAEEVCRTALANYVPDDDERGLKFKFLQPTEDSWNQEDDPDRVITCLLFDEDAPLIGPAAE